MSITNRVHLVFTRIIVMYKSKKLVFKNSFLRLVSIIILRMMVLPLINICKTASDIQNASSIIRKFIVEINKYN